ncbi:MAG TPA: Bro-N domain-containing protein [Afipia sp.]
MASGSENLSLTPFHFEGRNVRLIDRDGETWFVAADVARELGYRDAADLIRNSDADERGTHNMRTPSGDQEMSIVSSLAKILAASSCDLGDERDVIRTLQRAGIPDGTIICLSDESTELARAIRAATNAEIA